MSTSETGLRAELRETFALALPLIGASAGSQLMGLVDTAVVGRLGATHIGGAGIGNSLFFVSCILALGTLLGLDPLAAQAIGAGRPADARRHLREGVVLAALLSVPFTLLPFAVGALLPVMGVDAEVAHEAGQYVLARAPSMFPFLLFITLRSYLQALGLGRPSMFAMIVGNAVNLPAAWLFVLGDPGLERIGLPPIGFGEGLSTFGAGLAGSLGAVVQSLVLVVALRRVPVPEGTGAPRLAGVLALLRLGLPVGLQFLAEVGVFALVQFLMGRHGAAWAAGHNVALQIAAFTFTICLGVSQAASVRVGHAIGRRDLPAARRSGLLSLGLGLLIMSCSGLVLILARYPLAGLLADPPEVVEAAAALLVIAAAFQVFDGLQAVGAGVLRGAGDTRAAMWINVFVHLGITLPLLWVLSEPAGLGPRGLWWALTAGLALTAIALTTRFLLRTRPGGAGLAPANG
jgi:MATE family multidrug resistance protein